MHSLPIEQRAKLWALLFIVLLLALAMFLFTQWAGHRARRGLRATSSGGSRFGPHYWAARRLLKVPRYRRPAEPPSEQPPAEPT
ncbi:MAG TPA: hypothetical protein VHZ24_22500 [Pirellulales bacterium]|jgi:hypothetical protein|nr:hypothetical protein [Pirellulales bacterium]